MKELTELQDINHNFQRLTSTTYTEENDDYCIVYSNKSRILNTTEIVKYYIE